MQSTEGRFERYFIQVLGSHLGAHPAGVSAATGRLAVSALPLPEQLNGPAESPRITRGLLASPGPTCAEPAWPGGRWRQARAPDRPWLLARASFQNARHISP